MIRPILFSAPMVRAILDGTKTQTRRQLRPNSMLDILPMEFPPGWIGLLVRGTETVEPEGIAFRCKYGMVGDGFWVRETWARYQIDQDSHKIAYRATPPIDWPDDGRWRPSIHMPQSASRITLEITQIRCERLQSISPDDCAAEGVADIEEYSRLWDRINGPGAWAFNPWVWAINFKMVAVRVEIE